MDTVDPETRSRMMARVNGKNTRPELVLRKALHAKGFRYRLHGRGIPGRPDLVLLKHKALVFVHGCFWHSHPGCNFAVVPKSRQEFWIKKFEANSRRDAATQRLLLSHGWRVAVVWGCALLRLDLIGQTADSISDWLNSDTRYIELSNNGVVSIPGTRH